ncbi:MAG: hypothetical protein OXE42_17385 [Gammaproteobacteria bacterium]|nr:hypothetical protein [Gammaproteobacteria bacterium]
MGHHGAGPGVAGEAHRGDALAGLIGLYGDVVVLGQAVAVFPDSSDALVDLVEAEARVLAVDSKPKTPAKTGS